MAALILGLVTARGGSKGVPRKNLAPVGGKPLLSWTIEAARQSRRLDRVLLSTDDPEIAAVGRGAGADVPFLRPPELAGDGASTAAVVRHALDWTAANGDAEPDYVVILQPTSPFRTADDIDAAVDLALARDAAVVVSVSPMHGHPSWIVRLNAEGKIASWDGASVRDQRQDCDVPYLPNGAVFVVRRDVARSGESWYDAGALGYVMPAERAIDIDEPWDLELARLIAAARAGA